MNCYCFVFKKFKQRNIFSSKATRSGKTKKEVKDREIIKKGKNPKVDLFQFFYEKDRFYLENKGIVYNYEFKTR